MFALNRFMALVVLIILLSACTSIVGEVDPTKNISLEGTGKSHVLADSQNTRHSASPRRKDNLITIRSLDGKWLQRIRMGSDFPEAMLVDPGRHSMRVEYNYNQSTAHANLWFDAQAGKKYIIRCKLDGNFVIFWIEEETTGQRVGGIEQEVTPLK